MCLSSKGKCACSLLKDRPCMCPERAVVSRWIKRSGQLAYRTGGRILSGPHAPRPPGQGPNGVTGTLGATMAAGSQPGTHLISLYKRRPRHLTVFFLLTPHRRTTIIAINATVITVITSRMDCPPFIGPPLPPCPIPPYLLTDILHQLPFRDLLTCRSVSRLWQHTLTTSRPLRRRLFTLPPTDSPASSPVDYELHPVFRMLEYHLHTRVSARTGATNPLKHRIDFRNNGHAFVYSSVADAFATSPAARTVRVILCGGARDVVREGGVTVWDLMEGLDELVKERHERPDAAPQLEWDCAQFPFAGLRVVKAGHGEVHVKPEFFDMVEVTRLISRVPMAPITAPPLVTFDVGHDL